MVAALEKETPLKFLSITELNVLFNRTLEREIPSVDFEGEISQISRPASGHLYLSIKDERSQLKGIIWRSTQEQLEFKLEPGMQVVCRGKPNVFSQTGQLQVIISKIAPKGAGELQKKFLELKAKLGKEGLFDPDRKRPLPYLPKAVGVVTSGSGAVIHDIMVKIRERMPSTKVYLVDVRVQGEGAAQEIAAGINYLNESGVVDVIIVGRGGGSLEDLWAFNEEIVVRAIFASKIPVVSGVGHEVDISLSDFVADVRAPTPTAAAEMVVPKRDELLARLSDFERRLSDVDRWLQPKIQELDELVVRLENRITSVLEQAALRIETSRARLRAIEPVKLILLLEQKLAFYAQKLNLGFEQFLKHKDHELSRLMAKLEALGPVRVLQRGYALVEAGEGVVKSVNQIKINDQVKISFFDGKARAEINEILKKEKAI